VFVPVTVIPVVTPGPNTLTIIARSLHGGYRAGLVSCLGILLGTLIHVAGAAVALTAGRKANQVVTVFVSVDPGRDTTSVLKSYLAYFHMDSVGLTGTKEEIDVVVKPYGAKYEIEQSDSAAGYHVNHSTDLYLLDQQGELARTFSYSDGAQVIVDGVDQVIR